MQKEERGESGSEVPARAILSAHCPPRSKVKCYHCGKTGHIKRNCRIRIAEEKKAKSCRTEHSQKANRAALRDSSVSDDDGDALIASHALAASAANNWIVDSWATCHMSTDEEQFSDFWKVALGDGRELEVFGQGTIYQSMNLPEGKTCQRKLRVVLCAEAITQSFECVQSSRHRKTTEFDNVHCRIIGEGGKLLAMGTKVGSLYYLDYQKIARGQQVNAAETKKPESRQSIWHQRFGHLGVRNLQKLARDNTINGFDFDASSDLTFCEACVGGKHHKSQFPKATVLLSH